MHFQQTNQRAELTAIKECLKIAQDLQDEEILIISDSEYAIHMCRKFRNENTSRVWLNNDRSVVKHQELIKEILDFARENRINVSFKQIFVCM